MDKDIDYVTLVSEMWKNETEENKRNMAAEEEVERSEEYIKNLLEDDEE